MIVFQHITKQTRARPLAAHTGEQVTLQDSVSLCYLLGLAVATQHLNDFVLVQLRHLVASGTAVLAGVKLTGLFNEDLTNSGGKGQTAVAVDVDLANGALGSLAQLILGDTYCIGKIATVGVDDVNILLGNARRTVQHDGEAGELLLNLFEHVKCQGRRNELTGLRIASALLGLKLVSTVRRTDRDSQ